MQLISGNFTQEYVCPNNEVKKINLFVQSVQINLYKSPIV